MKKIFSVITIGAVLACGAFADASVGFNYRNGAEIVRYNDKGDSNDKKTTVFDLTKFNGGQDSMTIKASINNVDANVNIQPSLKDEIRFNRMLLGAKFGGLYVQTGFDRDGNSIGAFRVKKHSDDGNLEGAYFEAMKLGSGYSKSPATFVDNTFRVATAQDDATLNLLAKYTLKPNEDMTCVIQANVSSDHAMKGDPLVTQSLGHLGWAGLVEFKMKNLVDVEAVVKGVEYKGKLADEKLAMAFGVYAMPLMLKNLTACVGFGAGLFDGDMTDWAIDYRAMYNVDKKLSVSLMGKYSAIPEDDPAKGGLANFSADNSIGKVVGQGVTGWKGKNNSNSYLWDALSVRYVINDTFTAQLLASHTTDITQFKDKKSSGTTLQVTPAVQIYAAKAASVWLGVCLGWEGLGADSAVGYGDDPDFTLTVPVLYRVKL